MKEESKLSINLQDETGSGKLYFGEKPALDPIVMDILRRLDALEERNAICAPRDKGDED